MLLYVRVIGNVMDGNSVFDNSGRVIYLKLNYKFSAISIRSVRYVYANVYKSAIEM